MKKLLLTVIAVIAIASTASAQTSSEPKNIIGIWPGRLGNGIRIKYERTLSEKFTIGGTLTGYYGVFPGFQVAPAGRFYFKPNAPEGFYVQGKVLIGFYSQNSNSKSVVDGNLYTDDKTSFTRFGGGVAVGYQLLWGKTDRWSLDLNIGVKYHGQNPTFGDGEVDNGKWGLFGPGSIVDGLASIGYRF